MKKFYCANCGNEIDLEMGVFMFRDNYLQVKYFDDNKSNRFCCKNCACEALMGEYVKVDEVPLDNDEQDEEDEDDEDEEIEE